MRGNIISNNEKDFILKSLEDDYRIDGRRPLDFRRVTLRFQEDGRTEVSLGRTRVLAAGSCEIVEPHADRPAEGMINLATEFSPMGNLSFDYNRPLDEVIAINRVVERGIKESKALDTEALCIISGRKVWNVKIDLKILDDGGNLVDATSLAAVAALLAFRVPEVSVQGDDVRVYSKEEREPVPLCIHHVPIAVSFAFFTEGSIAVIDPSNREEQAMEGTMTIMMNSQRELCGIFKGGGVAVDRALVKECMEVASMKAQEIDEVLRDSVKKYNESRLAKRAKPPRGIDVHENVKEKDPAEWREKLKRQREEELQSQGPSQVDMMALEGLLSDMKRAKAEQQEGGGEDVYAKLEEAWNEDDGKLSRDQKNEIDSFVDSVRKATESSSAGAMEVADSGSEEEGVIIQEGTGASKDSGEKKKKKKKKKEKISGEVSLMDAVKAQDKKKKKKKKEKKVEE